MAQRRLINRSLGSSRKFIRLHHEAGKLGEFAGELFALLIPNADDHGRLSGDALTVKLQVFPGSLRSEAEFEKALDAMVDVGLIQRYEDASEWYIQIENFRREQPGIKSVANSRFPDPPENQRLAGIHRISPEVAVTRPNRTELKRTELKRTEEPPSEVLSGPGGPDAIQAIFDHWQSRRSTVKHREFAGGTRKSVRARIQDYTPEEIKLAIDRYDSVISDTTGRYWLNYRWDLQEFLSRGAGKWLRKFLSEDWERGLLANGSPNENDGSRPTSRSGDRAADRGPLGDKRYRPRTG